VHKYDIHNRAKEPATMYVQRRHRVGWKITQPADGLLVEESHYYVPVDVAASGKTALEVREETPVKRWVAIASPTAKQAISLYLEDPSADRKLSDELKQVLELQDKIGKLDRELARLRRAKSTLSDRQKQVRDNMKLLGKSVRNADLAKKLTASLKELETELNKVTRQLVSKDMKRSELQDRLTVLIKSISLEVE
jgi:chromosome segregation ATPase